MLDLKDLQGKLFGECSTDIIPFLLAGLGDFAHSAGLYGKNFFLLLLIDPKQWDYQLEANEEEKKWEYYLLV